MVKEGKEVKDMMRKGKINRSPKGMWSAIPIALLCVIVIWSEG